MDPSPPRFGFLYSEPLTISSGDVEEGVPYLPLANEWADIEGRLTAAGGAQTFVASATQDNLLQYLGVRLTVLHFSGHGDNSPSNKGFLLLENVNGTTYKFAREDFWRLLETAGAVNLPKLLFLSACYSENLISRTEDGGESGIPHIVAVKRDRAVKVRDASQFTNLFYRRLFEGSTVQQAFTMAVAMDRAVGDNFVLLPRSSAHADVLFPPPAVPRVIAPRAPLPPSNIDAHVTPFVGRQSELSEVIGHLQHPDVRLVVVCGPSGYGKTSVALKAARFIRERSLFPGGVFQMNMGAVEDFMREDVCGWANTLGSCSPSARTLLLLDGCDVDEPASGFPRMFSEDDLLVLTAGMGGLPTPPLATRTRSSSTLPGRTMANLQNLLNQRILKRFAHVKVVMTLNTPVDCEFGTRRVEIKPLSDMESVILFSKLYHAGLTTDVVRALVGGSDPSTPPDVLASRLASTDFIKGLKGCPRAIRLAASRLNLALHGSNLRRFASDVHLEVRSTSTPHADELVPQSTMFSPMLPAVASPVSTPRRVLGFDYESTLRDTLAGDMAAVRVWMSLVPTERSPPVVSWTDIEVAFNNRLQASMVPPRVRRVSAEEFGLIRDKALGPTGSGTGITVEHFKSLWTQWLGPIFHTLERLLPLWVETKPPVIYITTQARCDALLRAQGEFLIRLSESRPGWLALSYIPLIPGSISHRVENTRVEPTPDGFVIDMKVDGVQQKRVFRTMKELLEASSTNISTLCCGGGPILDLPCFREAPSDSLTYGAVSVNTHAPAIPLGRSFSDGGFLFSSPSTPAFK